MGARRCRRSMRRIITGTTTPCGLIRTIPGTGCWDRMEACMKPGTMPGTGQTASGVLCYSHMLFFQISPRFQRFDCKVFLTDALRYIGESPQRVMIDNTHVVVLRATGREMIPVPEMEAFAERFGFRFVAHQIAMPTVRRAWNGWHCDLV